ncbi:reverse transcriptase-like protein [bacterium]|nr:reverse transcriptase-like protein [bacterium]
MIYSHFLHPLDLVMRLRPFHPLTKPYLVRPLQTALLQTDGSFSMKHKGISRTAVILTTYKGNTYTLSKTYFDHTDSTESEWCSVLDGITYAIKRGQDSLELENDNLGVIQSLILAVRPNRPHIADYYHAIQESVGGFEYLGVRWIPRRMNRADGLFHV